MKNKLLRNILLFPGAWFFAMTIYAIAYRIRDPEVLWQIFIIPGIFLALAGAISSGLGSWTKPRKKLNLLFLAGAVLTDQAIKAYLFGIDWQNLSVRLIDPVFYIDPVHNTRGSYLYVLLDINKNLHVFNVLLFSFIGILFYFGWKFYIEKKSGSLWINGFIHLFLAGLCANIIDNIIWGGSLDYITIDPLYTFDLKDLYLTMAELFLLTELIDRGLLKRLIFMPRKKSKQLNREFIDFLKLQLKKKESE